eukprot:63368_1
MLHLAFVMLTITCNANIFGVNIFSTDQNFDINMIEDLIVNKNIYNFRSFQSWGRTAQVTNMLNKYAYKGTSLLLNIHWNESPYSFSSLFTSYNFDIKVQIDSCSWPSCPNPTEGGFCQGNYNIDQYINKLNECNSLFDIDIEFIIPWQNSNAASKCDYGRILQAALAIQKSNGRKFSLSATFYNFFHGPNIGAGVFPSDNINQLADTVQNEANKYANGLQLSLRLVETGWPDECDNGNNKGYGEASSDNMCKYYRQAIQYRPNRDVNIYWWIIDERDVGDGCGYGVWG